MLKGTIGLLLLVSLSGCGDVGDTLAGGSGVDAVDSEGLGNAASVAQALSVPQQEVGKAFTLNANTTTSGQVQCPSGSVVTGGGYSVSVHDRVLRNRKYNNGWQIRVKNSYYGAHSIKVYAICFTWGVTNVSSKTKDVSVAAHAFGNVHVFCPENKVAVGGGWYNTDSDLFLTDSSPVARMTPTGWGMGGWTVSAMNFGSNTATLQVRAVCAELDGLVAEFGGGDGGIMIAPGAAESPRAHWRRAPSRR